MDGRLILNAVHALQILNQISEHDDYKALIAKGFQPDLNIADAQTAVTYLIAEIDPESLEEPEN